MGLPYSDFVVNIQPDDYQQLNDKIQFFLDNPARLRHMQVIHPFSHAKHGGLDITVSREEGSSARLSTRKRGGSRLALTCKGPAVLKSAARC